MALPLPCVAAKPQQTRIQRDFEAAQRNVWREEHRKAIGAAMSACCRGDHAGVALALNAARIARASMAWAISAANQRAA